MEKQIAFVNENDFGVLTWTPTVSEFNQKYPYIRWRHISPGSMILLDGKVNKVVEIREVSTSDYIQVFLESRNDY